MLQNMVKKIEAEGKAETELHDKYMCYCETSDGELSKSIEEANTKIPQLSSEIKEAEELKAKLDAEIKKAYFDRTAAKEAMAKATAMRTKEAEAYAKESGTDQSNLAALKKALDAIKKGLAGGFLQTQAAQVLRKLSIESNLVDMDRQTLVSFLSGSQDEGYAPASTSSCSEGAGGALTSACAIAAFCSNCGTRSHADAGFGAADWRPNSKSRHSAVLVSASVK